MKPFGEYAPDVADLNTDTLDVARNVLPGVNSYLPARGPIAQSLAALPSPCKGFWFVQTASGNYDTYVATATKIYKYNASTFVFDDVSRLAGGNYHLPAEDFWSGTQYGTRLIVCQLGDFPQFIDVNVGTNFAVLPNAPAARLVNVMDDHVVFSCLEGAPRSIKWSAINDSEDYTSGTSGTQEFADAGAVTGFCPHAHMLFLERGRRGIVSTGDKYAFDFPEMSAEEGTVSPWSVIEFGTVAYWLSPSGFHVGNAENQKDISENRVSRSFFKNLNYGRILQVYGTIDPHAPRLYWAFASGDNAWNDHVMVYDRALDRFSELELDTYIFSRSATASISLDGGSDPLDMDLPGLPSLDSFMYRAGTPVLSAVTRDLKLSTMEGETLPALLETGSYALGDGRRVRVRNVRTFIEESFVIDPTGQPAAHSAVTVKVMKRQRYGDLWRVSAPIVQQRSGRYMMNADGAYHKFQISIPAGTDFNHVQGWEPDFVPTSER